MDFMILATDQIVNQAAKWAHMLGGGRSPAVTIRSIINRGGEQGAQHSQALHSWYGHVPGLRVVMPSTPTDARDLLIASVLCDHPVLYIDNRWLYERQEKVGPVVEQRLEDQLPAIRRNGDQITLVGAGYAAYLCEIAANELAEVGISAEVIDVRIINPFQPDRIVDSVKKTGRLLAVDDGWRNCGFGGEILASVCERTAPSSWKATPRRVTLPDAPAPTSKPLEALYYPSAEMVLETVRGMVSTSRAPQRLFHV
jgi:pyruvate dehydrogenase E1 component beta subunit